MVVLVLLLSLGQGCEDSAPIDSQAGFTDIQLPATGHFRTEQVNGRWVFVTPDGHPYVALGANHVGKFFGQPEQTAAILKRFAGDTAAAIRSVHQAMLDMRLTAGEAYDPLSPELKQAMPYVVNVDFPGRKKFRFDVFSPEFRKEAEEKISETCRPIARDSLVLGIAYVDLPVWDRRRADYFRSLPATAPGRQRYTEFLQRRYPTIDALNASYDTDFGSFAAIDTISPYGSEAATDDAVFLGEVADTLYNFLKSATAHHAPHKLFFGERFVLRMAPEAVVRSVGKYVDVFCTQALILSPQRPPEWQVFQPESYARQYEWTGGKPMLLIDWAAPFSLDSTYVTERGTVKDELNASREAARYFDELFELPYVIGAFKCQLLGSHGNDRWFPAGRMKRTYLRDDGRAFTKRTEIARQAHVTVLETVHEQITRQ